MLFFVPEKLDFSKNLVALCPLSIQSVIQLSKNVFDHSSVVTKIKVILVVWVTTVMEMMFYLKAIKAKWLNEKTPGQSQ